jgi:hypothetical protein
VQGWKIDYPSIFGVVLGAFMALVVSRLISWPPGDMGAGRFTIWGTLVLTTLFSLQSYFRKEPMMSGPFPGFFAGVATGVATVGLVFGVSV